LIKKRQSDIEDKGVFSPLMVFPEGGTTNGRRISPFKRGAFVGLRSVKPMIIQYDSPVISPSIDVIEEADVAILLCSLFSF
jgi:1-acyl-sn-glycerol-3-phosphate acyltransferase